MEPGTRVAYLAIFIWFHGTLSRIEGETAIVSWDDWDRGPPMRVPLKDLKLLEK